MILRFMKLSFYLFMLSFILVSCSSNKTIVNGIEERDANEILVFLNSKNIDATKVQSSQGSGTGSQKTVILWDIVVPQDKAIEAMNYLDEEGLPRRQSENLLKIFGNTGLVPSETQEKIRYQAGLAAEIANTIKQIDGVLDADVVISFPEEDPLTGKTDHPITASVYVKHNGVLDDPNSHLKTKIKELVTSSVSGLSYDNVTVIGDRAESTENPSEFNPNPEVPLVDIWSIVLAKGSSFRFRVIFFSLIFLNLILVSCIVWVLWKIHPLLKERSWSEILTFKQLHRDEPLPRKSEEIPSEKPQEKSSDNKEIDDI